MQWMWRKVFKLMFRKMHPLMCLYMPSSVNKPDRMQP